MSAASAGSGAISRHSHPGAVQVQRVQPDKPRQMLHAGVPDAGQDQADSQSRAGRPKDGGRCATQRPSPRSPDWRRIWSICSLSTTPWWMSQAPFVHLCMGFRVLMSSSCSSRWSHSHVCRCWLATSSGGSKFLRSPFCIYRPCRYSYNSSMHSLIFHFLTVASLVWVGCSIKQSGLQRKKEPSSSAASDPDLESCSRLLGQPLAAGSSASCADSMMRRLSKVTPPGLCTGRSQALEPGKAGATRLRCVSQLDPHHGPYAEIEFVQDATLVKAIRLYVPYQGGWDAARKRLSEQLARHCHRKDNARYRCRNGIVLAFTPWAGEAVCSISIAGGSS